METHRESLETLGLNEESFFGGDPSELPKADVRLKDGDHLFNMDIVVLETPGHTPGSVCFYAEKEGILFSGDTLFFDGVGRTDLPGGSEKKLRESIQKKIGILPAETRVFPGHGPFTTVEREKRGNLFFRESLQDLRPETLPRAHAGLVSVGLLVKQPAAPAKAAPRAAARGTAKRAKPKRAPSKTVARAARKRAKPAKVKKQKTVTKARGSKGKPGAARKSSQRAARPSKKRVQARRSTKAPGSGRKRPR
jgi:glyoxylase-like metal-dependent hydrolase (beta-lactamase superfamily II)